MIYLLTNILYKITNIVLFIYILAPQWSGKPVRRSSDSQYTDLTPSKYKLLRNNVCLASSSHLIF